MKVYLSGPTVFRADAEAFLSEQKSMCKLRGLTALTPLDTEIDETAGNAFQMIYQGNINLIHQCEIVIADISPFRGISVDPGTAFEIGYAKALGKQVIAYSDNPCAYRNRVMASANVAGVKGKYPKVENFGLIENLMIAAPVVLVADFFEAVAMASNYSESGKIKNV